MFTNLKLAPKFTLLLSLVFISAIVISGITLSQATEQKAEADVASQGRVLMAMVNSVRNYTDTQISPILIPQEETAGKFIPQAIPSYSAREVFEILRQNPSYQELLYKDALLNPTNLRDKADEFEANIVEQFRNEANLQEISGFRTLAGKQVFYQTRPIIIKKDSCLRCHSTPAAAPKSQLATYGTEHGFGWKLNKVLGIQVIYVPSSEVFGIAQRNLALVMGIFIGIFALVILLINFLLKQTVIQPIRPMARLAKKISNEQMASDAAIEFDIENLEKVGRNTDELGQLARLFKQMAHAIYVREQTFAEQLQQLRNKSEQMKVNTQSKNQEIAYLKALQQKARTITNRTKATSERNGH